jgi:hypothetical protein
VPINGIIIFLNKLFLAVKIKGNLQFDILLNNEAIVLLESFISDFWQWQAPIYQNFWQF